MPTPSTLLRRSAGALAALAALALPACDATDSLLGEFEGTLDVGAAPEAVEGDAIYTVVQTDSGPRFLLGLFVDGVTESSADEYDYVLFRLDGGRPGVGAYAVDNGAGERLVATATLARVDDADGGDARGAVLRATDGTLSVARVDPYGFLLGSFQVTATGVRIEAPGTAVDGAAAGRFEARYEPPVVFERLGLFQ